MSSGAAVGERGAARTEAARLALASLASAAANTNFSAAPDEVRTRVVDLVADTIAVTAWGSRRPELITVRNALLTSSAEVMEPAGATVIGTRHIAASPVAVALNGSAAAADQLQDGHREARGHPASHVVLAALALAEERDLSTEAMLSAILAGYEVGVRLGRAMRGTPDGVHDIGTWGAVAVAVTTAHLVARADVAAVERAVELAAATPLLTDATTVFTGWTGGHAFLGASIAHGLWIGQAAAAGLAAAPGSLDRFFARQAGRSWAGLDVPEPEGGWSHHEVLTGYLKLHPTCAHLHGVLDATEDLLVMAPIDPGAIRQVIIRTYAAAAAFAEVAETELQARFSIPTAVALFLVRGVLDQVSLTDASVTEPAVRALAERVHVIADRRLEPGYPTGRPARVEIHFDDGTIRSASSTRPRGDADGSTSQGRRRAKVKQLVLEAFGPDAGTMARELEDWHTRHTPRKLGAILRAAAADGSRS